MNSIQENYYRIQEKIAIALQRSGRGTEDARLVGVSKFHTPDDMRKAYEAGLRIFGESRAQEAERKYAVLKELGAEWHLVGALQTNKAKKALALFDLIHSVDSTRLIATMQFEAAKQDQQAHVLLQLNLAGETTKRGVDEAELELLLEALRNADRVRVHGLMTLPPYDENPEKVRPYFRRLREIAERYHDDLTAEDGRLELSMGMSHDFPVAIEEGATLVRVGTALFGERPGYN